MMKAVDADFQPGIRQPQMEGVILYGRVYYGAGYLQYHLFL